MSATRWTRSGPTSSSLLARERDGIACEPYREPYRGALLPAIGLAGDAIVVAV